MFDFKNQSNTENTADDGVGGGHWQAHSGCDGEPGRGCHHCSNETKCDVLGKHSVHGAIGKVDGENTLAHRICYSISSKESATEFKHSSDDHCLL